MKPHSIERRVVTLFLLVELLSAVCMTGFVFLYERHTHFRSLDVEVRGRADTLMGAVVDADDVDDRVVLNLQDVRIPAGDVYEVWDNGRSLLGRSPGWAAPRSLVDSERDRTDLAIRGVNYRMVRITALRTVDPEASGVRHSVVVVYGSPTRGAWRPVMRAVRAFALASTIILAVSAVLVLRLVRSSMSPLQSLAGEAACISSSQWRFAPPAGVQQTRELAPLVTALDDLVARLQVSFAQQRRFVSDSAHELKTAVTVVKSSLQLLELRERTTTEYRAGMLASLNDCLRMEDLVQRMLTLARVEEAGQLSASHTSGGQVPRTDLAAGAREAAAALEPVAGLRGVALTCAVPGLPDGAMTGDIAPEDWQTLCTNLLLNSIQHSGSGSSVRLTLEEQDGRAICRVEDQGQGIADAALPHVFDRFFRSDESRARATGGSGLGLAICKAIVDRVGGRISIESTEGAGTVVTVDLSLAPAAGDASSVHERGAMASAS